MATRILRKVGWALIIAGLLDIGFMIYCIVNKLNYSSSFNIFAVIAGIFLLRQNLRAAKVIAWFAAFMLGGFVVAIILFPLLTPPELMAVEWRTYPLHMLIVVVFALTGIAFVNWIYRQLTSEPVMEARRSAGLDSKQPRSGLIVGALLVMGIFGIMVYVMYGPPGAKVIRMAQKQYGSNYRYHVTSMQWSGSAGNATLTAYNHSEIRTVRVTW